MVLINIRGSFTSAIRGVVFMHCTNIEMKTKKLARGFKLNGILPYRMNSTCRSPLLLAISV